MNTTEKLGLRLPEGTDSGAIADLNYNAEKLDEEVSSRIKTLNGESADENGNYNLNTVPYARQLITDDMQSAGGEVLLRSTGGGTPLTNGRAMLKSIQGRMLHTGYVAEALVINVVPASQAGNMTASIDRNTFVGYVTQTSSLSFLYTNNAWTLDGSAVSLATYGITVTGTPASGDAINVSYIKEERGTITVSNLTKFIFTGWNLYNHEAGYAHVPKYSETYGFKAGGYTALQFSETLNGERSNLYPNANGIFTIPSTGYVWVIGGNDTDTYVLMTWSDWTGGYPDAWSAYEESEVSVSAAMSHFPYGLMCVGDYADEIVFNYPTDGSNPTATAYSRVGRMAYNAENLAIAEEARQNYGLPYEYDTNYIYLAKANADTYDGIAIDGTFTADDHGTEWIFINANTVATVPVYAIVDYQQNLVSKLRMDVATLSEQSLTEAQQIQVRSNIGAASGTDILAINSRHALYARLQSASNIPANGKIVELELPSAGTWLINGGVKGDFGTWFNGITNHTDRDYISPGANMYFSHIFVTDKPTSVYLQNLTGGTRLYNTGTMLEAIKLSDSTLV